MRRTLPPTTDPRTIMSIVNRGGRITREQFHIVWRAYADEEAREWLYRVGKAQSAGWPA